MNQLKTYLDEDIELPEQLVLEFMFELKVSNLFIPAILEDDEITFEYVTSDEDESKFIPLFTDIGEFDKRYEDDDEFTPLENEFETYQEMLEEDDFEGIILNIENECMPVDNLLLSLISQDFTVEDDSDIKVYGEEELKDIYENISNDSLIDFIKNDAGDENIDSLMAELSNSTMLNLVVLDENTPGSDDEVITIDDVDGFNLCTIENNDSNLGVIFTDKDAIVNSNIMNEDINYYAQITRLTPLFDFILRHDMDGVVINPNTDSEFLIPRSQLLSQACGIELIVENPAFKNSLDYAFLI